jgi:hypothetical protein
MTKCSACKNKSSNLRCENNCLTGLLFCGIHSKTKSPRLWSTVNNIDKKIVLVQKVWRGYHIRYLLKLAGPGVLNRKICNNSEELFTFDEAKTVNPFDYFSFEENSKVYWFDIRSLIQCLDTSDELTNPYTRQSISSDVKKRLSKLFSYRLRRKLPTFHTEPPLKPVSEILINRFRHISHILQANDFFEIKVDNFLSIGPINIRFYLISLIHGFKLWSVEHCMKPDSQRHRYLLYVESIYKKFNNCSYNHYLYIISSVLLSILNDCSDPFQPCFIIMSGLYSL